MTWGDRRWLDVSPPLEKCLGVSQGGVETWRRLSSFLERCLHISTPPWETQRSFLISGGALVAVVGRQETSSTHFLVSKMSQSLKRGQKGGKCVSVDTALPPTYKKSHKHDKENIFFMHTIECLAIPLMNVRP